MAKYKVPASELLDVPEAPEPPDEALFDLLESPSEPPPLPADETAPAAAAPPLEAAPESPLATFFSGEAESLSDDSLSDEAAFLYSSLR